MLKDDDWCFACGRSNPHGLQLTDFAFDGEYYSVQFTAARHHQGWMDMTHGGIVATLLDEVMTRLLWEQGHNVATAELSVRYHQAAPVGEQMQARSWLVASKRRYFQTAAELLLPDGSVIASAQAKFLIPRDEYEGDS
jgi:uncharacterized protein (TIGR00369 family)